MDANLHYQLSLFDTESTHVHLPNDKTATTFIDNMKLPVHRWFRFSAGFSAQWVESLIEETKAAGNVTVFDPFAGSGTSLVAAEQVRTLSYGVEAHPFIARLAKAKLCYRSDVEAFLDYAKVVRSHAERLHPDTEKYVPLIQKCFDTSSLQGLDCLRSAWEELADGSPQSQLTWLALVSILRQVSHVGTAPWQYVLPTKTKSKVLTPLAAYDSACSQIANDMRVAGHTKGPNAILIQSDARTCEGIPSNIANLVITSPPYPNNYDYADATRLEMSFMGEIASWGELQQSVRRHLMRSCSQHVPERSVDLEAVLATPELECIRPEIREVCNKLAVERLQHGGKKTYHLMIACYFLDIANVWKALRRVCTTPSLVCFVIGDSAPYGIHVPAMKWIAALAQVAGFRSFHFEKIRDRNVKWKNRKHQVPLCEGRLWIEG